MIDLFLDLFDQRKLEQWSCYLLPIERNELGNYRSRSDRDIAKMSYEIDCIKQSIKCTSKLSLPERRHRLARKLKIDQVPNPSHGTDAEIGQFV